jgi:hypothetical protein
MVDTLLMTHANQAILANCQTGYGPSYFGRCLMWLTVNKKRDLNYIPVIYLKKAMNVDLGLIPKMASVSLY